MQRLLLSSALNSQLQIKKNGVRQWLGRIVLTAGLIFMSSIITAQPVIATSSCQSVYPNFRFSGNLPGSGYEWDTSPATLSLNFNGLRPSSAYTFKCSSADLVGLFYNFDEKQATTDGAGNVSVALDGAKCFAAKRGFGNNIDKPADPRYIFIEGAAGNCNGPTYLVYPFPAGINCSKSDIQILQNNEKVGCVQLGEEFTYSVSGLTKKSGGDCDHGSELKVGFKNINVGIPFLAMRLDCTNENERNFKVTTDASKAGSDLVVSVTDQGDNELCSKSIPIQAICKPEDRARDPDLIANVEPFKICEQIKDDSSPTSARKKCEECVGNSLGGDVAAVKHMWTAVGCIENNPTNIILTTVKIGLGVASGVTLLMILAASFSFTTAGGDAKKVTEAREMITSAIIGLIFIVMSVTILQFIGVTLIHIPGFGGT